MAIIMKSDVMHEFVRISLIPSTNVFSTSSLCEILYQRVSVALIQPSPALEILTWHGVGRAIGSFTHWPSSDSEESCDVDTSEESDVFNISCSSKNLVLSFLFPPHAAVNLSTRLRRTPCNRVSHVVISWSSTVGSRVPESSLGV